VADAGSACWNRSRNFEPAARTLIVTDHFRSQMGASAREASSMNPAIRIVYRRRSAQVALTKGRTSSLSARALIPALAREAQQAGARLSFDTAFPGNRPQCRRVASGDRNQRQTRGIACGQCCRRGRCRQPRGGALPVGHQSKPVPLVQAIVRLPKDCPPDTTRVWFVPD